MKKNMNPFAAPKSIPGISGGLKARGKGKGLDVKTTTLRANSPMLDKAGKILFGK